MLDSLNLMVYALEYDDHVAASVIRDHSPLYPFEETHVMRFAVLHGCFRAVYSLRETRNVYYGARRYYYSRAHREILGAICDSTPRNQLMHQLGLPQVYDYRLPVEGTMYEAAKLGDLDIIKWLHSGIAHTPFLAVEHVARAGHLACAQSLVENVSSTENCTWMAKAPRFRST